MHQRLLIIGSGFSGQAVARAAGEAGMAVVTTTRGPAGQGRLAFTEAGQGRLAFTEAGQGPLAFAEAGAALPGFTHLLMTAPPGEAGDPFLAVHGAALPGGLVWAGYLSTTGVYGDRGGAWVDEATPPAPGKPRSVRRLAAEEAWRAAASGRFALDLFRVAGIYGSGRSAFDDLRAGHARRTHKPGHAFGRIHVEDIAQAVLAAIARPPLTARVLHLSDDEPAESAVVVEHAASLLGVAPPPLVEYAAAEPGMSEMARSFWSENRRVSCTATKAALGIAWRHPSYREGLAAILKAGG